MTALEELESVTADERRALLERDWDALRLSIERKQELAGCLELSPHDETTQALLQRVRQATLHNAELARRLSAQTSELLKGQTSGGTYNRNAQLQPRGALIMHRTV
ncbi:MAG: hypothetical protein IT371_12680 [Deltaproteobacteria bacterium]|nr:hypothetical protein [Deltaproteobacteria bacterium]